MKYEIVYEDGKFIINQPGKGRFILQEGYQPTKGHIDRNNPPGRKTSSKKRNSNTDISRPSHTIRVSRNSRRRTITEILRKLRRGSKNRYLGIRKRATL